MNYQKQNKYNLTYVRIESISQQYKLFSHRNDFLKLFELKFLFYCFKFNKFGAKQSFSFETKTRII